MTHPARNNAEWCDLVCRTHGIRGAFDARAWTSPRRTPLYYPDAVTLSRDATAADVLDGIDGGPGASVKDSFATLDLPGFEILFEAQWIERDAPEAGDDAADWRLVETAEELREWERDLFSGDDDGVFGPGILAEPVEILRGEGGGAVLNRTGDVVGVSNVFGLDPWPGVLAMAARLHPGLRLVGYETDPEQAVRHGFTETGPLRIWLRT
ncbi:hypothetical protein ACIBHX_47710 [Nonomuraea sp. NPDC050536]|uniref:hypothetical protein n=1 Tax=Nonomuraea sp. NPDC050536 TaxID=3364366 RepID=UPI0037C848E5